MLPYRAIIFLISLFFLPVLAVSAQEQSENLNYVQGPNYKVINQTGGFTVEWKNKAAAADQIKKTGPKEVTVYTPEGEEQLIILLKNDGSFAEVIDLEYVDKDTYLRRKSWTENYQRRKDRDATYDWSAPREFTFQNGMTLMIVNDEARASLNGGKLEVSGERGRYRVITKAFEAGIAYGPEYGTQVYRYFKEIE
jgi:hypothetical protein